MCLYLAEQQMTTEIFIVKWASINYDSQATIE
jgi:hypothetical protein